MHLSAHDRRTVKFTSLKKESDKKTLTKRYVCEGCCNFLRKTVPGCSDDDIMAFVGDKLRDKEIVEDLSNGMQVMKDDLGVQLAYAPAPTAAQRS